MNESERRVFTITFSLTIRIKCKDAFEKWIIVNELLNGQGDKAYLPIRRV